MIAEGGGSVDVESGGRAPWSSRRLALASVVIAAAGLAAIAVIAPGRGDLLVAASAGAAFGCAAGIIGYGFIARRAAVSVIGGVQVFLAVMTVKMLAFAAFLLTIALTTSLNPAALAIGLVGTTLAGEVLVVASLRRVQVAAGDGGRERPDVGKTPDR